MQRSGRLLLYTLHCGNLYGTERMALATLGGFADGHRIVLAPGSTASPSLLEVAAAEGYECHRIDTLRQLVQRLSHIFFRHKRVDVISTSASHNLVCAWMAAAFGVHLRQLNVVHGGGEERYSYANKRILNRTRVRLVAVSRFVLSRLVAHGVVADRVAVVENFMAKQTLAARPRRPAFDPVRPASKPLVDGDIRVVVVSRVDPFKRLDVLMSAIATGRLSMCRFDVYGDGESIESFREQARVAPSVVRFHGHDAAISARLAEADFLVHTCHEEPFGLVALEAFAAGLPVIVPDAGGMAELVEPDVTGFRYEALSAASLCQALLRAMSLSGAELDRVADAASLQLQQRFSEARGVAEYRAALAAT